MRAGRRLPGTFQKLRKIRRVCLSSEPPLRGWHIGQSAPPACAPGPPKLTAPISRNSPRNLGQCDGALVHVASLSVVGLTRPQRLVALSGCRDAPDGQVIEGCNGVGLGPEAYMAGSEAPVAIIQEQGAVEPSLNVVARDYRPDRVPLAECRRLDARTGQHAAVPLVVIEPEV